MTLVNNDGVIRTGTKKNQIVDNVFNSQAHQMKMTRQQTMVIETN
jgi:hypothetical protein